MGGALALDAAWLFAAFLILAILAAAGIAARRFLLERGGGTVECGLRKGSGSWRLGVASYQPEELRWFRIFGLSLRPNEVFPRRNLTVVSRRPPSDAEAASLGPGMIVVECKLGEDSSQIRSPAPDGGAGPEAGAAAGNPAGFPGLAGFPGPAGTVELAMGEAALTGLLAWLEAAPPGSPTWA
ncbi:MAG TPA: DUF2550 domain-containing protein [Vicinamibacteria bacterium]|nr:DUF2550 domain-containing protein [Vicinamibacteria bacterium]